MPVSSPVGYLYWYTTSVILFILTLINISTKFYSYFSRPTIRTPSFTALPAPVTSSSRSPRLQLDQVDAGRGAKGAQLSTLVRGGRVAWVIVEKYVILTALPLPRMRWWIKRLPRSSIATTELIWQVGYTLLVFVLSFWGTGWDILTVSNQTAWIAVAQIPLIIALAGKNNIVSFLTGIPHEKLNFLHRAAGRLCLVGVWIHAILSWAIMGGFSIAKWHTHQAQWGATGIISFSMLYATSIPFFRRRLYEFFLVTHICLAALTLAAFIMHWSKVDVWVYPGIGLWVADRLFRSLRLAVLNKLWDVKPSLTASNLPSIATLTLLTPSTLMVSFQTPSLFLTWSAGQHFYVVMPSMSRLPWETHPFTATTIPRRAGHGTESGELTFIVRVRDGFTKRMKEEVDKERKAQGLGVDKECKVQVKAAVEGPYGEGADLSRYNGVVIISGGSGISFALSHLLQIIRDAKEGKTNVRDVRVIWMVKSRLHLNWISSILLEHVHSIPSTLRVTLHIHVTKHYFPRDNSLCLPVSSVLPTNPGQREMNDLQTFFAKRTAEPKRRKSRLGSTLSWATWTGAWGEDGQVGPGTRRGTVISWVAAQLRPAKKLERQSSDEDRVVVAEVDLEKGNQAVDAEIDLENGNQVVLPTFSWTEGYANDQIPTDFGVRPNNGRTEASQRPNSPAVQEDEEVHDVESVGISPFSSFNGRSRAISLEVSPDNSVRGRDSVEFPSPTSPAHGPRMLLEVPRLSLDVPPNSAFSTRMTWPFASTSPVSFESPPITPPPRARRMSISIEEPEHPRRQSPSRSRKSSAVGGRITSLQAPQPRRPSPLLNVAVQPAMSTYLSVDREEVKVDRPLSANSILSIPSSRTLSPGVPLASGALTPALAEPAAQSFAEEALSRRRQSLGLECLIRWHEGRADLQAVVREMMAEIGPGGWVSVNACGPKSLLDSARKTVREVSSVEAVWRGGVGVSFHAETFGW